MDEQSDHDRLIRMDQTMQLIEKQLSNHLKHHWAITIAMSTLLVGGLFALILKL